MSTRPFAEQRRKIDTMHGLVSLLPEPYYSQVEDLWKELETDCGLTGIRVTPFPHFSWQIAQDYDFELIEQNLQDIARTTRPFSIRTTGLGLFTGLNPVLFIPLVKSDELMALHARIWEHTLPAAKGYSPFYHPEAWLPHISLAYQDIDQGNIASVMAKLAFRSYTWEMPIDNISLIYEPSGETGTLRYHFKFLSNQGEI